MRFLSRLVGILFLTSVFPLPGATQEKPIGINIGYSSISGSQAILRVIKDAGIFQRNGLDVSLVLIAGGSGIVQALVAGDLPIAVVSGELIHPLADRYDEVLAVLDRLEEYAPGAPDNVYERVAVDVLRAAGGTARAWVYLAAAPLAARLRASGTPIPGGDWLTG